MTTLVASAGLPTRFGEFKILAFTSGSDEHVALVKGRVDGAVDVPMRIHSQCLTGDALCSLRCDCREQLERALAILGREEKGVLVYLSQEGRGIGLANKIKAYALQDQGFDTVEANNKIGFDSDLRDYSVAVDVLKFLGVKSVRLMTNNPEKIRELEERGVIISSRIPLIAEPNEHNAGYLKTKEKKMKHLLGGTDD